MWELSPLILGQLQDGGSEETLCKKEQEEVDSMTLRSQIVFLPWGLLEKIINFLEGEDNHVIYCLNLDLFKSERVTGGDTG